MIQTPPPPPTEWTTTTTTLSSFVVPSWYCNPYVSWGRKWVSRDHRNNCVAWWNTCPIRSGPATTTTMMHAIGSIGPTTVSDDSNIDWIEPRGYNYWPRYNGNKHRRGPLICYGPWVYGIDTKIWHSCEVVSPFDSRIGKSWWRERYGTGITTVRVVRPPTTR